MVEQSQAGVTSDKWDEVWLAAKRFRNVLLRTGVGGYYFDTHAQVVFKDGQKMFFNFLKVDYTELERSIEHYKRILG